jgi:ketosteroid isomerase-like protein
LTRQLVQSAELIREQRELPFDAKLALNRNGDERNRTDRTFRSWDLCGEEAEPVSADEGGPTMSRIPFATVTLMAALSSGLPAQAQDAARLLADWSAAYAAADKAEVKRLYSSDARLLSEFSPHEEVGWAGVAHYFGTVGLGPSPLRMHIDSQSQREFSDVMLVSGRYTLLRERWDGSIAEEASRFTLALRRTPDGQWQIAEQHSSRVPATAR